jgi:glycosyltransferase involved in cell wall biosynthesis
LASLTVTIITKNEAHNIAACLASVSFADQLVVVDSGSTDGTAELARQLGAEVTLYADWQGFGIQKGRALALAKCDWVLSVDADERVTPELKREIQNVMAVQRFEAYSVPRLSSFCGQYMHHSGWYPDRVLRLFRQGKAQFSDDVVHEKVLTQLEVGQLQNDLLHETYRDMSHMLAKSDAYSTAGAAAMFKRGQSASVAEAVVRASWAFIRTYVLRRGFLDGQLGFVLATSVSQTTYHRYIKLWLLGQASQLSSHDEKTGK